MGAGAGLVTGHALADLFQDRAQERGGSCIQLWEGPSGEFPPSRFLPPGDSTVLN